MKFKLNRKGVRQLLRSQQIEDDMNRRAERIAARAGDGFTAGSFQGKNRARADVFTDTPEAMRAEIESYALTGAIDAGR